MLRYVASHHVASCRVMSRYVALCHVMSRHVMSRHVIMPRDVPHVTSCHVTSCHVMSHLAPSCHVMSYHVTSYHVESRGTVTRPTLHCQLTSSTRNQFKLSMTVFVGCPEGCRYHTASAVYDLVLYLKNKRREERSHVYKHDLHFQGHASRSQYRTFLI